MSRLHFITAIPQDVQRGSGCYVGTWTLARALRALGIEIDIVAPRVSTPAYLATRILFNETLRWRRFDSDATIGIDADGYSIGTSRRLAAREGKALPHVACIKAYSAMRSVSSKAQPVPAWRSKPTSKPYTRGAPIW